MNPIHRLLIPMHRKIARPFLGKPRLVMIIGVMRSGSSLLSNILTTNPMISGFGESHVRYEGIESILDLKYWIFRFTKHYPGNDEYLLDKVLHDSHLPSLTHLIEIVDFYPIFLIREPLANARSLQKMFSSSCEHNNLPWEYLENRYAQLEKSIITTRDKVPIYGLSYKSLTDDTQNTLADLSRHLDIHPPLTSKYNVPTHVGRWGLGDGSEKIKSGSIIQSKIESGPISVPPKISHSYQRLLSILRKECGNSILG